MTLLKIARNHFSQRCFEAIKAMMPEQIEVCLINSLFFYVALSVSIEEFDFYIMARNSTIIDVMKASRARVGGFDCNRQKC